MPQQHPDTVAFREEGDEGVFRAAGVSITPVVPMREWRLQYQGELRWAGDKKYSVFRATRNVILRI